MEYAEYNPSKNQLQEPKEPELQKQYRRTYQLRKTWKIAQWHHRGKFNAGMNLAIENAFNRIREQIKMLYAQHQLLLTTKHEEAFNLYAAANQ